MVLQPKQGRSFFTAPVWWQAKGAPLAAKGPTKMVQTNPTTAPVEASADTEEERPEPVRVSGCGLLCCCQQPLVHTCWSACFGQVDVMKLQSSPLPLVT